MLIMILIIGILIAIGYWLPRYLKSRVDYNQEKEGEDIAYKTSLLTYLSAIVETLYPTTKPATPDEILDSIQDLRVRQSDRRAVEELIKTTYPKDIPHERKNSKGFLE